MVEYIILHTNKIIIKCLLILLKNNSKMPINNYHNSYIFFKSYYIKKFCALHMLPISFSNVQGNFIRNLKKKKNIYIYIYISILKCMN